MKEKKDTKALSPEKSPKPRVSALKPNFFRQGSKSKLNVNEEEKGNKRSGGFPIKWGNSSSRKDSDDSSTNSGDNMGSSSRQRGSVRASMGSVKDFGSNMGNMMKTVVMTPVVAGQAVAKGATEVGGSMINAGIGVGGSMINAGTTVTKSVGHTVGHTVVGATQTLEMGGKSVFKGAKGFTKGIRKNFYFGNMYGNVSQMEKKSKWEEGIEVIESVLAPGTDAYESLTPEQRKGLQDVKKLLISGPGGGDKTQYIPKDLIKMKKRSEHFGRKSSTRASTRLSTNFLLQEYAGVTNTRTLLGDMADCDFSESGHMSDSDDDSVPEKKESIAPGDLMMPRVSEDSTAIGTGSFGRSLFFLQKDTDVDIVDFVPTEFKRLSRDEQLQLHKLLSWESLKRWDFNIFDLHRLTRRRPLLFLGWAVLGSPYAQNAMAKYIGLDDEDSPGYTFMDELMIPPSKLCNFLRVIESDYRPNPYHNGIHAADVVQSLHTLIQSSLDEAFMTACPQINLFTILLSAVCHDVDHPGVTNAFHTQLQTELAVMYNDTSVLENWHVAHAFARMLDVELLGSKSIQDQIVAAMKNRDKTDGEANILCNATPEQFKIVRTLMIEAILHTDMSKHFEMVNAAKGLLLQELSEENTWKVLMFMLHMADISGQAKGAPLFTLWTSRCMDEFFAQGDEEAKLGLPISPNCDRKTIVTAESQVGFIKFVVEPAYVVLAQFIPFVQVKVLPIITSNLEHWLEEMESGESKEVEEANQAQIPSNSRRSTVIDC